MNKEFWEENVITRTDALIVLMHEMFHVALGDTNKIGKGYDSPELMNLSQDMRINAAVIKGFVPAGEANRNILTRMYPKKGIMSLLRPGVDHTAASKYWVIYKTLYDNEARGRFFSGFQKKSEEIFKSEEGIRAALKILEPPNLKELMLKFTLLGSHGNDEGDNEEEGGETPVELELDEHTLSQIQAEMGKLTKDLKNSGIGDTLLKSIVDLQKVSLKPNLRLLENFSCSAKMNKLRSFFPVERTNTSVVPIKPSGRDMALMASGFRPVL